MHACHNKKMPEKASEKPDFASAWLNASIEVDNAKAVLDLVWQSMADNDWRDLLPEGMTVVANFADMHRFALDAAISILAKVGEFFDENEGAAHQRLDQTSGEFELIRGKVSSEFMSVLDQYKWAVDAFSELCPTQDEHDERFDGSMMAKERFVVAQARHVETETALATYKPRNLAELRLKVRTICDLRLQDVMSREPLDAVLLNLLDFGKVANG